MRSAMVAAGVIGTYVFLVLASTSHMSASERAEILTPWKAIEEPIATLHVQMDGRACRFENVFIGDGAVRTASHCVPEEERAKDDREKN